MIHWAFYRGDVETNVWPEVIYGLLESLWEAITEIVGQD